MKPDESEKNPSQQDSPTTGKPLVSLEDFQNNQHLFQGSKALAGVNVEPRKNQEVKEKAAPQDKPKDVARLSEQATDEEIKKFLMEHRESVDYTKIWPKDTPIMFMEEEHPRLSPKNEMIKNLKNLKDKNGLTHLAMEMLQEEDQPLLDRYFAGKASRDEVLNIFKKNWDWGPGVPEKYMEMVDAIKDVRLKLLCIDLPHHGDGLVDSSKQRNGNWARIMHDTLKKNSNVRILAYCGASHSGNDLINDSPNEILADRYGHKSVVVGFAGCDQRANNFFWFSHKVGREARPLKLDQQRFGIPLRLDEEPRDADYMIHLPQVEKYNGM